MEPMLIELAVSAGSTLVRALTTESYDAVKNAVVGLWQRHSPKQAEAIVENLDTALAEVSNATGDAMAQVTQQLNEEWVALFRSLLRSHPDAAEDTRRVVDQLAPMIAGGSQQSARDINQTATVQAGGISFQAGNNISNVNLGRLTGGADGAS